MLESLGKQSWVSPLPEQIAHYRFRGGGQIFAFSKLPGGFDFEDTIQLYIDLANSKVQISVNWGKLTAFGGRCQFFWKGSQCSYSVSSLLQYIFQHRRQGDKVMRMECDNRDGKGRKWIWRQRLIMDSTSRESTLAAHCTLCNFHWAVQTSQTPHWDVQPAVALEWGPTTVSKCDI